MGGEFDGHSIPTLESTLTADEFVTVEVGIFGAPGAHAFITATDFSLRINGKDPIPSEGFAALSRNLRDPFWIPPNQQAKEKSRGGISAGGQGDPGSTPAPVHIPPEMERAMRLQVQGASLPEGDRALPIGGLLFFRYSGDQKGVHKVELIYEGAAGKGKINIQN
jgi:hypothetical protein